MREIWAKFPSGGTSKVGVALHIQGSEIFNTISMLTQGNERQLRVSALHERGGSKRNVMREAKFMIVPIKVIMFVIFVSQKLKKTKRT